LASALRHLGSGAQPSLWKALVRLRPPTLILAGERDPKFSAIARSMARAIPGARLRLFAGAGHAPHLEAPDEYVTAVLDHFTPREGTRPRASRNGRKRAVSRTSATRSGKASLRCPTTVQRSATPSAPT